MTLDLRGARSEEPLLLTDAAPAWDPSAREEVAAIAWIQDEVAARRKLPLLEAEFALDSLYSELRWGARQVLPLIPVRPGESFLAVHAANTASLAMVLAKTQNFDEPAVRRVGLAAMLHDIGMTMLPRDIVQKRGQLTPEERERVKQHPVQGARILLSADDSMDLAAVVAYEHHLRMDGSGYPLLLYPRSTHYVSRLVQLCDVFCSLSSPRSYRQAWPVEIILSFLAERAGFEFHPALANALTSLIQQHTRVAAAI